MSSVGEREDVVMCQVIVDTEIDFLSLAQRVRNSSTKYLIHSYLSPSDVLDP